MVLLLRLVEEIYADARDAELTATPFSDEKYSLRKGKKEVYIGYGKVLEEA